MSYQMNLELHISDFPGPMTLQEIAKLSVEFREEIQKAANAFLEGKFVNMPSLRVPGASIVYLAD